VLSHQPRLNALQKLAHSTRQAHPPGICCCKRHAAPCVHTSRRSEDCSRFMGLIQYQRFRMCFAALFNLGGGETILILALVLILLGAKKLPDFAEGLRKGSEEFTKATREVTDEIAKQFEGEHSKEKNEEPLHAFLMALTFILGVVCLILVLYEFSK